MPIAVPPALDLTPYISSVIANANFLISSNLQLSSLQQFWLPHAEQFSHDNVNTALIQYVANLYNLEEFAAQQTADIASFTEFIANNLTGGGGVDLSTVEFYLQSILRDSSNIAQTLGGGAPLGFGDIVNALDNGFFSVADQIFSSSQLSHFDISQLINALGQAGAGGGVELLKNDLARIPVLLEMLIAVIQLAAGVGDPATQKIADNTADAAQLEIGAMLAAGYAGKVPVEDYMDFLQNSEISSLSSAVWQLLRVILPGFSSVPQVPGLDKALSKVEKTVQEKGAAVSLTDAAMYIIAQGPGVVEKIINKVIEAVTPLMHGLESGLNGLFEPAFKAMLSGVKESVEQVGEVGPAGGFRAAEQFLSKAAINGMHAHHIAEIMEMIPWTKHFGLNTLPAFMSDMAGFGAIAQQTWGRAVGEGVGRAAGYEINASMRSRLPDPRLLEQMVFEGQLSEHDQAVLLSFYGYNDDYIARIQKIQYIEPNLRQISGLAADASMPEAKTEGWLREIGFSPDDAAQLLPIVMQQSMRAERGSLETEVMANLRAGLLTEADAELYFDQLHLHPLARQMLYTSARLGLRRNSIEDNITTYKQLYGDGLLDNADFHLALQTQGVTETRIAVELAQVSSKRTAKVAETEAADTKAEVRKQQGLLISAMREAFQHGMIDGGQFEAALEHAGIVPATAAATVQLEVIKLDGRALTSRSAEAARILQREQRLREDTFVELFRKGAITNLQLQQFLLGSGIPSAVVGAIVDRELARIRPTARDLLDTPGALKAKELFTLAKAKLQVQFSKAVIDADTYLRQLVALGMDIEIAQATVALEVAKRSGEMKPPAPATVTSGALADLKKKVDDALEKFAQTDQTAAALEDVLSRLGIVEEVLDALVALANEQQTAAAAQETALT